MKEETSSYVDRLIERGEPITLIKPVEICTDSIKYQYGRIKIGWTGSSASSKDEFVLTQDELNILFKNGLLSTGAKNYNGYICPLTYFGGTYVLEEGTVVCGSLAPSGKNTLRKEIYEYLCAKGYVTNIINITDISIVTINMMNGRKALHSHPSCGNVFDIVFYWNTKIVRQKNPLIAAFTKLFWEKYYKKYDTCNFYIDNEGFYFFFISEEEVFSEKLIQLFRRYDFLLDLLSKGIDPKILLYSVSKRIFLDNEIKFPERFLSIAGGTLDFPVKKTSIKFSNGYKKLLCGRLYHESDLNCSYRYVLSVSYTEKIRGLMLITRRILRVSFPEIAVLFSAEDESLYVSFKEPGPDRNTSIENEFLSLDMAIYLVNTEKNILPQILYEWIISLLEDISSSILREEYRNIMKLKKIITVEYFTWIESEDYSF